MNSYTEIEPEIIEQAKSNEEAFVQLYRHYGDRVLRFLIIRTRHMQLAEDLTQETFISVMQNLPSYRVTGAPFSSWLFQIALNHLRGHWRKKSNIPTEEITAALNIHNDQDLGTQWMDFFTALSILTEEEQHLLIFKYIDDMPNTDIARVLHIAPNTCTVRISRALKKLHSIL